MIQWAGEGFFETKQPEWITESQMEWSPVELADEITDSITADDTISYERVLDFSITDGLSFADLANITGNIFNNSVTDGISFTELISVTANIVTTLQDQFNINDAIVASNILTKAVIDAISLGDNISGGILITNTIQDGIQISDELLINLLANTNSTDGFAIQENTLDNGTINFTITDSLSINDTPSPILIANPELTDDITIADTIIEGIESSYSLTDDLSINDASIMGLSFGLSITDDISLTDDIPSNNFDMIIPTTDIFENLSATYPEIVTMGTDKAIVLYTESNILYVKLIEVNGYKTTYHNRIQVDGITTNLKMVKLNDSAVAVYYNDGNNSNYPTVRVITLSGTTLTIGDWYAIENVSNSHWEICELDSTHFYISQNTGSGAGRKVYSVSGTTLTVASTSVASTLHGSVRLTKLTDNLIIETYDGSSNKIYGQQITFDSSYTISENIPDVLLAPSTDITDYQICRLTDDKALLVYKDDDTYGKVRVLELVGNDTVERTEYTFNSTATSNIVIDTLSPTKAIVSYDDTNNYTVLDISGTVITPTTIDGTDDKSYPSISNLDDTKAIVAYQYNSKGYIDILETSNSLFNFNTTTNETITIAETVLDELEGTFNESIIDGITTGDETITTALLSITTTDNLTINDDLSIENIITNTIQDSITIDDSSTVQLSVDRFITDAFNIDDTESNTIVFNTTTTDGLLIGELLDTDVIFVTNILDGTSYGDVVSGKTSFDYLLTDGIVLADETSNTIKE